MKAEITEQEILNLLRDENQRDRAFEWIVKTYSEQIYFHVRRMVISHDDADDVTQSVFIKAWKSLANFRGDSKLGTWLYRIATSESITFINRRKRLAGIPLEDVSYRLSEALVDDVYFEGDEIERKLQAAIAVLPEKQKTVFLLRYYDEMPYDQISEVTGTSVGGLKASYHHAVKKIEAFLTDAA